MVWQRQTPENFWSHVDQSDANGCWPWKLCYYKVGYGCASYAHKSIQAHRLAWIFTHGEIPNGLWVLHRCDNRSCCNPAHLFLGTPQDNYDDMAKKGRRRTPSGDAHWSHQHKERVTRGERNGAAKLTEREVLAIRAAWVKHRTTTTALAKRYNVSIGAISMLINRKTWTHVA